MESLVERGRDWQIHATNIVKQRAEDSHRPYWRGIREVLPEAFDEPSDFSVQKGFGVTVLHMLMTQVIEIARSRGDGGTEPTSYANILRGALEEVEGENASGDPVKGATFWRAAPLGAAGSYSSSAGRRVLVAKMQQS